MAGAGSQLGRRQGEQRFHDGAKARRNRHAQQRQYQQRSPGTFVTRVSSPSFHPTPSRGKAAAAARFSFPEPENRAGGEEDSLKIAAVSSTDPVARSCNLERFLESTTPTVPAQYPSKVFNLQKKKSIPSLVFIAFFLRFQGLVFVFLVCR